MIKKCEIDGNIINFIEIGTGQNIVFLHGWGRNSSDFTPLVEHLSDDYRKIAIDIPGHGLSDEPTGDLSLDGITKTLIKFFEKEKIKKPILVCHSFGARLALKLVENEFEVSKLIFTGGAGIEKKSVGFKLKVLHYKFMKFLVKTPFYTHFRDDLFANSGSVDYKNASETMKKVLSFAVNENLTNVLTKIKVPTLLYWGENDSATPIEHAYIMNEKIINSKLIIKEELTHYAFLENIQDFNCTVEKFIGGEYNE